MQSIKFENKNHNQIQKDKIARIYFSNNYTVIFEESGLCKILNFDKICSIDICKYVPDTIIVLYNLCYFIYEGIAYIIYFHNDMITLRVIKNDNSNILKLYFYRNIKNNVLIYYVTQDNKIYTSSSCIYYEFRCIMEFNNCKNIENLYIQDKYIIIVTCESIHIYENEILICEKYSKFNNVKLISKYLNIYFVMDGKLYEYYNKCIFEYNRDIKPIKFLPEFSTNRIKDMYCNNSKFVKDATFIGKYMFIIYDDNTATIFKDKKIINEVNFDLCYVSSNNFIILKDGILRSSIIVVRNIEYNIVNMINILGEIYLKDDQGNIYIIGNYINDAGNIVNNNVLKKIDYSPMFTEYLFEKSRSKIKSAMSYK